MKRTGSWGMMDILDLKSKRPRTDMSTSSIVIDPLSASTRRNNATLKDDFPVRYRISKIIQIGVINPPTNLNHYYIGKRDTQRVTVIKPTPTPFLSCAYPLLRDYD